jgi:hypothetical protein
MDIKNANLLFNINTKKMTKDPHIVSAMVTRGNNSLGHCCVLDKKQLKRKTMHVFLPFTNKAIDYKTSLKISLPEDILSVRDDCWVDKHKFLEIDKFDAGKFESIKNTVENKHNISFIIRGIENLTTSTNELKLLMSKFKYCMKYLYLSNTHFNMNNLPTLFLSFLNLKDCIPIINTRKVDGLCLSIILFDENLSNEESGLFYFIKFNIILSNYKDNVLIVDGVNLPSIERIEHRYITIKMKELISLASIIAHQKENKDAKMEEFSVEKEKSSKPKTIGLYDATGWNSEKEIFSTSYSFSVNSSNSSATS